MSQSSLSIAQNKVTIGRIEKIRIYPGNMAMRAKIDTGAKTSSLGCENINIFEREGTKWVRFKVTNYKGTTKMLERKVERTVIIKRHFGRKQERVVVRLGICLGTIYREAEVSLIDRSGFNYQILIGRTFLIDNHIIVDPSQIGPTLSLVQARLIELLLPTRSNNQIVTAPPVRTSSFSEISYFSS